MKFLVKEFKAEITRKKGDLSLRALEKKLKISASTISRLEDGQTPDLLTYATVCNWMEASMNKYFEPTREEKMPRKTITRYYLLGYFIGTLKGIVEAYKIPDDLKAKLLMLISELEQIKTIK